MNNFIQRVKIRDMESKDILPFKNYWYRSPEDFIRRMGVDPDKMLPESEFENSLNNVIAKNTTNIVSKLEFLTIELDGHPVGTHSVGDLIEGETAIFHAHLWKPEARGIGLCTYTYPRAAEIFMNRFKLQNLLFKTPIVNKAANRIKEKLGIAASGEEVLDYSFMFPGTIARVYSLSRSDLASLLA
jgi:hypothetical protein